MLKKKMMLGNIKRQRRSKETSRRHITYALEEHILKIEGVIHTLKIKAIKKLKVIALYYYNWP